MSENQENDTSDTNTNKDLIICQNCPSIILRPGFGTLVNTEFKLPVMRPKSEDEVSETETLTEFWSVPDMYHFENIGYSRNVGDVKYLICADCEIGPIGLFQTATQLSYLSLARVKHTTEK